MSDEAVNPEKFDVPDGWDIRRLEELIEPGGLAYGIVQPGGGDLDGIPMLRVADLRGGRVRAEKVVRVAREVEAPFKRTRLSGGELLLSLVGSVGEVAVVPPSFAGWNVARAIAVIRPQGTPVAWLRLCLISELAQRCMGIWQTNTVQATLNLRDVRRVPILLPPTRDRDAIIEVIGALDDKIENCERIVRISRNLGDSYFTESMSASVGRPCSFGDLVAAGGLQFGDGYRTKRAEHGQPGLPILRVAEISDGRISANCEDFVSGKFRQAMGDKISKVGDVVLTTKGTVGRVAIILDGSPEFVYSPQVCYFRVPPGAELTSGFLYFWFRSDYFWSQARSRKSQTDMADYINLADLRSMVVTIPVGDVYPILRQRLAALEGAAGQAIRESTKLAELRDALLPKLMSGEIRVKDAEKIVEDVT